MWYSNRAYGCASENRQSTPYFYFANKIQILTVILVFQTFAVQPKWPEMFQEHIIMGTWLC